MKIAIGWELGSVWQKRIASEFARYSTAIKECGPVHTLSTVNAYSRNCERRPSEILTPMLLNVILGYSYQDRREGFPTAKIINKFGICRADSLTRIMEKPRQQRHIVEAGNVTSQATESDCV